MKIAVYLKPKGHDWSRAQYVQRIDLHRSRPTIHTQPDPCDVAPDVSLDALTAILSEHIASSAYLSAYRLETSDHFAYIEDAAA